MQEDDATIRIAPPISAVRTAGAAPPPRAARRPAGGARWPLYLAAGVIAAGTAGAGAWFLLPPAPVEPPPKPDSPTASLPTAPAPVPRAISLPRPGAPAPQASDFVLASEQAILAHRGAAPAVFRLAENPRVFVLDFPDLDAQGAALNRIAALIEKAGLPRDRLLPDIELAAAIARSGDTPATYYYGHNYRGRDLDRFFALAERDGIALNPAETWLRDGFNRMRTLVPTGEELAVLSVPGIEPRIDEAMRRAILHHEIGHGHFFTNRAFAGHVARVWHDVFTESERAAFRAFLDREGYDPSNDEIMMNEAMAYLIFTPDQRFFSPGHAGLSEARADQLRAALRAGAPR